MICASVYLLVFMRNLLMHLSEKILLMQPLTFGGDYRVSGVGLAGVGLEGAKNLFPQNSQAASKIVQSRRLHVSRRTLGRH